MQKMKKDAAGVYPYSSIFDAIAKVNHSATVDRKERRYYRTVGGFPNLLLQNRSAHYDHPPDTGLADRQS